MMHRFGSCSLRGLRAFSRSNSQLVSAQSSARTSLPPELTLSGTSAPSPNAETATRGRHRPAIKPSPKRPTISSQNPREWNRPVAPGVLPAYDEALKVIEADSRALKKELGELQAKINELEGKPENAEELAQLKDKARIVEIQSEINLPWTRWQVSNALADMSKPVHRHLVEQRWREEGDLDLLMERLHQMFVIPDVLPELHPTLDLAITVRRRPGEFKRELKPFTNVEPGTYTLPQQTMEPPRLYVNVFHPEERLYTLVMVDPDVPDSESQSYTTYLHWLQPNVPLSATTTSRIPTSLLNSHTPYIPPHPQQGTPYHRYTILLIPQPSGKVDIPTFADSERLGFNLRDFIAQYKLGDGAGVGGGAHMFRQVWNPFVSNVYENVLKTAEPKYGLPRKVDVYEEVKKAKRYL